MTMIRTVFLGLALLLPVSWTAAQAADEAPAGETPSGETKKAKKTKKSKKADKAEGSEEKKAE